MTMNLADIWEAVADRLPDHTAQIHGEQRSTYRDFENRAARLAAALRQSGVGEGTKVALYLYNGNEYLETVFAALKLRAVPVNVNFRYLADELHYLLDNSDAEAIVYHGALAERVREVRGRLPKLRSFIQVTGNDEDRQPLIEEAEHYEDVIARNSPAERIPRSSGDFVFLYTGGTTGLPKGVMWRHADLFVTFSKSYAPLGGFVPKTPSEAAEAAVRMNEMGAAPRGIAGAPLMHGMAWFTSMSSLVVGGTVLSLPSRSFDAHELWRTVERDKASTCVIVGDAFARPMLRALEEAETRGEPYDISSLFALISAGVMWTASNKKAFLERGIPMLIDGLGSSEATGMGMMISTANDDPTTAKFQLNPECKVITEDGRFVEPGSEEIGMLGVSAGIPMGYYKDEEKTAATFKIIDAVRYSIPGDYAKVEADGSITLLGRGSVCINTGGEKVFPEEVEEIVKLHRSIEDCTVVGIPDEKWGEAITAVVSASPGATIDVDEVIAMTKKKLAAYKAPKHILVVDRIVRSPAGKADYRWAKETARQMLDNRRRMNSPSDQG
jgi:fatty-acyl-CoA synthase